MLQAIRYPKGWFIKAKLLKRDLHPLGSGEPPLASIMQPQNYSGWKGPQNVSAQTPCSKHVQHQTQIKFAHGFFPN